MASVLRSIVQGFDDKHDEVKYAAVKASFDDCEKIAKFEFPRLTLDIIITAHGLLKTDLTDNHRDIHRTVLDPLRQHIRFIVDAANAGKVPKNIEAFVFVVFEALDTIHDFEVGEEQAQIDKDTLQRSKGWRADGDFDHKAYISNPYGLDTSTVPDTAYHYLKKEPPELCEDIGGPWRITHVESILRKDLARRFEAYRRQLETALKHQNVDKLRRSMPPLSKLAEGRMLSSLKKEDIIDDMLAPRVTYHGTPLRNVSSIVRHGFKCPGTQLDDSQSSIVASPRSGIAWKRGIYSSQAPFYALSYASYANQITPLGNLPTMRLFVCATVMGRTLSQKQGTGRDHTIHGPRVQGYDSHFDGSYELIVHNDAAILPCYVIHLDFGAQVAKEAILKAQTDPAAFERMTQNKKQVHPKIAPQAPGDAARVAAEKKAAARKHFPYGFGPAGVNFVIEEIGSTVEDEEDYGGWQPERHGFYKAGLDQYQDSRRG